MKNWKNQVVAYWIGLFNRNFYEQKCFYLTIKKYFYFIHKKSKNILEHMVFYTCENIGLFLEKLKNTNYIQTVCIWAFQFLAANFWKTQN